jgi:phenylacetate-CoA ligase
MKMLRHLPRFQKAYRALDELAAREQWSRSQIETFQLERLNALWQEATEHVPYYCKLRSDHKLPKTFRSLTEFQDRVPILPKAVVRSDPQAFQSNRIQHGRWHRTGGSTGTPMSFFWGDEAHQEVLRTRYRLYAMWGVDPLDRTAFLWGHEHVFSQNAHGYCARAQQQLTDRLRGRLRLSAYQLGERDVQEHLDRLRTFRPRMLYGFSRAIHVLALAAKQSGWHCDALQLVTMTSEVATPSMAATIEQAFGAPAIREYGASECHLIAGDWPDRTLRVREDVALLETSPRDDQRFDLILTPLGNTSFPLIRYRIGDVTDHALELREKGFAILRNIAGRNDDLLVTRSGRIIHPALIDAIFEEAVDPIRRYRVHQQ